MLGSIDILKGFHLTRLPHGVVDALPPHGQSGG